MNDLFYTLFLEYQETENEWVQLPFSNTENPKWNVKRQCIYTNGVVIGKYREQDVKTLQAIQLENPDNEIYQVISNHYFAKICALQCHDNPDYIKIEELKCNYAEFHELKRLPLNEWINRHSDWVRCTCPQIKVNEVRGFLYLYYAFEDYKRSKDHPLNINQERIEELYLGIFDKTSQFQKYGLLPVDDYRELLCVDPPRICDSLINKTLMLKNLPLQLADKFQELIQQGKIGGLLVRVSNTQVYDGQFREGILLEEVERGKVFSLTNLGTYMVTKLFSDNYDDCLWIVIDSENITFEELCEDFMVFDNQVVTQVVHLQYMFQDNNSYITHLDHEYIFYTLEEFEQRKTNVRQKGNAQQRMKSFKIDNANIPFNLSYDVSWKNRYGMPCPPKRIPFLCYVLDCYFTHKDLLLEYFNKTLI